MIFIQLDGGLGNQLFQYALGRRLAYDRNVELLFDLSLLQSAQSNRQYKLNNFCVRGRPATLQEVENFYFHQRRGLAHYVDVFIQRIMPYYQRRIVYERSSGFDPHIFSVSSNVALCGYWQSEKYFADIRSLLLEDLQLAEPFDMLNQRLYEQICSTDSVSLHVRRGDYATNPKANLVHGVLPLGYYQRAMKKIEETVKSPHYYVFSDDISWTRSHVWTENITFVEQNGSQKDYFDLALMSACKYHILANSSFSWWAAWLCSYPKKKVLAPHNWYRAEIDISDLIPPGWEAL